MRMYKYFPQDEQTGFDLLSTPLPTICDQEGYIVQVNGIEEGNFIRDVVVPSDSSQAPFWTGVYRDANDNGKWLDKEGNAPQYFNWNENEPNDVNGMEDCVEINPETMKWNDVNCADQVAYVVEYEPPTEVFCTCVEVMEAEYEWNDGCGLKDRLDNCGGDEDCLDAKLDAAVEAGSIPMTESIAIRSCYDPDQLHNKCTSPHHWVISGAQVAAPKASSDAGEPTTTMIDVTYIVPVHVTLDQVQSDVGTVAEDGSCDISSPVGGVAQAPMSLPVVGDVLSPITVDLEAISYDTTTETEGTVRFCQRIKVWSEGVDSGFLMNERDTDITLRVNFESSTFTLDEVFTATREVESRDTDTDLSVELTVAPLLSNDNNVLYAGEPLVFVVAPSDADADTYDVTDIYSLRLHDAGSLDEEVLANGDAVGDWIPFYSSDCNNGSCEVTLSLPLSYY